MLKATPDRYNQLKEVLTSEEMKQVIVIESKTIEIIGKISTCPSRYLDDGREMGDEQYIYYNPVVDVYVIPLAVDSMDSAKSLLNQLVGEY